MVLDGVPRDDGNMVDAALKRRRRARQLTGLPPHDIAAEEAVIAAIVLDDEAVWAVRAIVKPEDFFREQNGWAFRACLALADRNEPVTIPTCSHEMYRMGVGDIADGWNTYLAEIAGKYFTAVGVEAHARIVARDAMWRRFIQVMGMGAQRAYEGGPEVDKVFDDVERSLVTLRTGEGQGPVAMAEDILDSLEEDDGDDSRRIPTGYTQLDTFIRGQKRGQVSVIGGRQDSGKSALMISMALRQAQGGTPVGYIPLEDSVEEMWVRLAGDHLPIGAPTRMGWDFASKQRQAGAMTAAEWEAFKVRWSDARASVANYPISFPRPGLTPASFEDLTSAVGIMARKHNAQVVYIDYLDALPKHLRKGQSTADYVAGMMVDLQNLAVRLDIHIAVGSQISNEGEKQPKDPPPYQYLLDSGGKARSARLILMVGKGKDEQVSNFKRPLFVSVEKLKGYPLGRLVKANNPNGGSYHPLYIDVRTGLVREVGES